MNNAVKPGKPLLMLLCMSTIAISSCASTGYKHEDYNDSAFKQIEPQASVSDYEQLTNAAAKAYSTGDLKKAESLFTNLQSKYPQDSRSAYNLAMLNLQKAYEGLQLFVTLETNSDLQRQAERILKQLTELR